VYCLLFVRRCCHRHNFEKGAEKLAKSRSTFQIQKKSCQVAFTAMVLDNQSIKMHKSISSERESVKVSKMQHEPCSSSHSAAHRSSGHSIPRRASIVDDSQSSAMSELSDGSFLTRYGAKAIPPSFVSGQREQDAGDATGDDGTATTVGSAVLLSIAAKTVREQQQLILQMKQEKQAWAEEREKMEAELQRLRDKQTWAAEKQQLEAELKKLREEKEQKNQVVLSALQTIDDQQSLLSDLLKEHTKLKRKIGKALSSCGSSFVSTSRNQSQSSRKHKEKSEKR